MQEALDQRRSGVGQHLLEGPDVDVAALALGVVDLAVDIFNQHRLVMGSVEDHDLAQRRHVAVVAPQEVALRLRRRGGLVGDGAHAQRVNRLEHRTDRAVFARRVHAL